MPEEQKQSWWKSMPGMLTTATGFVAALSGLVAGLNQLGVLRRDEPAPLVVDTSRSPGHGQSQPAPAPAAVLPKAVTASPPRSAAPPAPAPTAISDSTARADNAADTAAARPVRLPKGTVLELVVPSRTCAPADGQKRFTARLVTPVRVDGATVLPANTIAVLHVRRAGPPAAPQVRLDSLGREEMAVAVPASQVRLRRDAASGACLRANARMAVTLGAAVAVQRP